MVTKSNKNIIDVITNTNTTIINNGSIRIKSSSSSHLFIRNNFTSLNLRDEPSADKDILVTDEFLDIIIPLGRKLFKNEYIKLKEDLKDESEDTKRLTLHLLKKQLNKKVQK
jgi:hypothetical protein